MLKRLSTKKLTGGKLGGTLLLDVPNSDLINLVVSKQPTQEDSLNVSEPALTICSCPRRPRRRNR